MSIKLIAGLQNPGPAYEHTRHNAGAWLVEKLAASSGATLCHEKKMHALYASLSIQNKPLKALLPLTYMNHSGQALRECTRFYQIDPEEVLVVHDELDLPPGRVKFKTGGGHGGHNGLRDIIAQLGSANFHRLRIGIGHPGHRELVLNYVLGKPSVSDHKEIHNAIDRVLDCFPRILSGTPEQAMNLINC